MAWLSSVVSPSISSISAMSELRGRARRSSSAVAVDGLGSQMPSRTLNRVIRKAVMRDE